MGWNRRGQGKRVLNSVLNRNDRIIRWNGNSYILKVGKTIIHQDFRVIPFIRFVGRPATGKHAWYQYMSVFFCSTGKAISGTVGKSGFDTECTGIGRKKNVMVMYLILTCVVAIREQVRFCLNDLQELFVLHGISCDHT